jgi:hypothetical protein
MLTRRLFGQEVVVDEGRAIGGGVVLVAVLGGDADGPGKVDFAGPETIDRGRALSIINQQLSIINHFSL